MMSYLKDLEKELKYYRPKKPLFLYPKNALKKDQNKSVNNRDFLQEAKEEIISSLIRDYGERVFGLEMVGENKTSYDEFEIKNEDKMELERNARYHGIIYYGIFEDEIFVTTLYDIGQKGGYQIPLPFSSTGKNGGSPIPLPLEVEYEATLENLLSFLSRTKESDLKSLLDFIKKDKNTF